MKEKYCLVSVGGGRMFFYIPERALLEMGVKRKGLVSFDAMMEEIDKYFKSSMIFTNLVSGDDGCALFVEVVGKS